METDGDKQGADKDSQRQICQGGHFWRKKAEKNGKTRKRGVFKHKQYRRLHLLHHMSYEGSPRPP